MGYRLETFKDFLKDDWQQTKYDMGDLAASAAKVLAYPFQLGASHARAFKEYYF